MTSLPKPLQDIADLLKQLPQIGPRQASRLALALFRNDSLRQNLALSLQKLGEEARICERCGRIAEETPCSLCSDTKRDSALLMVVEEDTDLEQMESTHAYKGHYFVLGGRFATSRGPLKEQGLRIDALTKRLEDEKEKIEEVILALNPTLDGDALAHDLALIAKRSNIKVSRLGRGLPTGGEIEYADEETLTSALEHRS